MNMLIARKAAGILIAAALLTTLFVVGSVEKAKLQEAGIK